MGWSSKNRGCLCLRLNKLKFVGSGRNSIMNKVMQYAVAGSAQYMALHLKELENFIKMHIDFIMDLEDELFKRNRKKI